MLFVELNPFIWCEALRQEETSRLLDDDDEKMILCFKEGSPSIVSFCYCGVPFTNSIKVVISRLFYWWQGQYWSLSLRSKLMSWCDLMDRKPWLLRRGVSETDEWKLCFNSVPNSGRSDLFCWHDDLFLWIFWHGADCFGEILTRPLELLGGCRLQLNPCLPVLCTYVVIKI
jgi:hypothetical protein